MRARHAQLYNYVDGLARQVGMACRHTPMKKVRVAETVKRGGLITPPPPPFAAESGPVFDYAHLFLISIFLMHFSLFVSHLYYTHSLSSLYMFIIHPLTLHTPHFPTTN